MTDAAEAAVRFARLVEEASGHAVGPAQLHALAELGLTRARARGLGDLESYVDALERGALADEWRQLLSLVTVKESYFFRTPEHFRALESVVLPELLRRRGLTKRLRAWSAGCARGEEPGSLAMVLSEAPGLADWDWRILATDVDENALADARVGRYRDRAVTQVPEYLRTRHLRAEHGAFELDAAIRNRIDYRVFNLIEEPFEPPDPPYDIIFLRNVLIYFRPESQRRVARSLARALAPDGFLFLGPSETLWQLTDELQPIDLGDCFCYRHPGEAASSRMIHPFQRTSAKSIQSDEGSLPTPSPCPTNRQDSAPFLGSGEEAVAAAVQALAVGSADEARVAVAAALLAGPTDPSAHALEGLLGDASGDPSAALAAYRAALFLDPYLFQIRLLLADCLRLQHVDARAWAEYRTVLGTIDSGRARELAFATALSLPDRESARERALEALKTVTQPSR